jgi:hypothetical protein
MKTKYQKKTQVPNGHLEPEPEPGCPHYLPLPDALWFLSHPEVLDAPAKALIPLSTLSKAITIF